jgi:hypothetical protein
LFSSGAHLHDDIDGKFGILWKDLKSLEVGMQENLKLKEECDEKKMHLLSRCMACRKRSSEHTGGISKEELRLCEEVIAAYKKTLEVFKKYPKELLSIAVHNEIEERLKEIKHLRDRLNRATSEKSPPERFVSCPDGAEEKKLYSQTHVPEMTVVEKELQDCEEFMAKMKVLESDFLAKTSGCCEETAGNEDSMEEVDGVKLSHDERMRFRTNLRSVKCGLEELSEYFEQLNTLARSLNEQKERVKKLKESCEVGWLAVTGNLQHLVREKDREIKELKEKLRLQNLNVTTVGREETAPKRLLRSSLFRGGDLTTDITSVKKEVNRVKKNFEKITSPPCSQPVADNPEGGRNSDLFVPGSHTLPRLFSIVEDELPVPERVSEPITAENLLEKFKPSFLKHVDAEAIASRLQNEKVISEGVQKGIEGAKDRENAAILLYRHLHTQATFCTLTTFTIVVKGMEGYQQMISIGVRIQTTLEENEMLCNCSLHKN